MAPAAWSHPVIEQGGRISAAARELGAALVELPVDGVFFTGSYATGKKIAGAVDPASLSPEDAFLIVVASAGDEKMSQCPS